MADEDATPAHETTHASDEQRSGSPETGDLVIDAALRDLATVDPTDLDRTLEAGDAVHSTLTTRLSDLGT